MQGIRIRKRDGRLEPLNVDKVHRVVEMMVEGLEDVSLSEVEIGAQLQFTDGMTSERIQELIIRSAEDLISPDAPNYQYVASRGQLYDVRKRAFGNEIPSYSEHVNNMIKAGYYDPMLLDDYSAAELAQFDAVIDHRRDNNFGYAACGQLLDKYLIRDRTKHRAFKETPQMMYMAIACSLLSYLPSHNGYRAQQIIKFYNAASTFDFSLPTPIMAGARTPTRQFSSCVLIKCGDTLPSINATALAITNYVSKRAGIGWDIGEIRAEGSPIRNGEMTHTGLLPFLKYHVGALKSCSQGGIRGGSGTVYYPWWHYQFDDLIVLKNNRGIEENRERRADYGVQLNGFLLGKYLRDEDVYLFDPKDCPDMYAAFFADQEKFALLYEDMVRSAERGEVRFKKFTAKELLNDMLLGERTETGRIYIAFVDNMNSHSPFDPKTDPIYQSNLCLEIALPTREFQHEFDEDGRIALCTLASFNMSKFIGEDAFDRMQETAELVVQALDGLLRMQDYPMIQAKIATDEFRTLGVGIVNLADFFMQQGLQYGSDEALEVLNKWMEKFNYSLTRASVNLAKQDGPCEAVDRTCYAKGIFPWELYSPRDPQVELGASTEMMQLWAELRSDVRKYGIRNATLSAIAPTESSSQVLNATNGVEMPKAPMSIKASKSGNFKQIVPDSSKMGNYQYLWKQPSPEAYLRTCAVAQKWIDQSISTNTFYIPMLTGDEIQRDKAMRHIIAFHAMGGKTLYYSNVYDGAGDEIDEVDMAKFCAGCVV
ncbi:ribonucleoside-diphosphate reductase large subunit [Vibrio phage vB_VcorM_GR28A]|nr:ribonucleoside-diphosphate reductase large subunit [Vibrio phage vB_VcorM_GR28A]